MSSASSPLVVYGLFAHRAKWELVRMLRRPAFLTLLMLGLANLAVGLVFGLRDAVPTTRIVLDVVHANFGLPAAMIAIVCAAGGVTARRGVRLASRVTAVALATFVSLTFAGLLAVAFQLARGQTHLQLPLYAHGLYFNLGWHALHLAALAVFVRALFGSSTRRSRRFAVAATVFLYLGPNLAFDHPLLRFGAPASPWSDFAGYGPYLATQIAAGSYWSALCVLLLTAAHVFSQRGKPLKSRLTTDGLAMAWAAVVALLVAGSWTVVDVVSDVGENHASAAQESLIQPRYLRLDLQVDVFPEERAVSTKGTAIVVNRYDVDIPALHFTIPPALDVYSITLTGELAEQRPGYRRYLLNRPLEPGETLLVEFRASLVAERRSRGAPPPRLLANGTFLYTTDLMPIVGDMPSASSNALTATRVTYRTRVGTSLEQVAIAPGELARSWREEGRAYFEYQPERPIPLVASIHSGRYAVAHAQWHGVAIEAYHHPAHGVAVPTLLAAAKCELTRRNSAEFSIFRVVEVPAFEPFAHGPRLLAFGPLPGRENRARLAATGVLPYSEVAAFIDEGGVGNQCRCQGAGC